MVKPEQKIAKVRSSFIGFEDHGLLSVSLDFDYGSAGQGIGHRGFGSTDESRDPDGWKVGHEMGMDFIRRLLLAFGVDRWDKIVGRTALVTSSWTAIHRIDPLPTEKGEPLDIDAWAESFKAVGS